MEEPKHTYEKQCPHCACKDPSVIEFLGPYIPEKGFARAIGDPHVEQVKYRYRCNSEVCRGKEFTANWGGDSSTIIQNEEHAKKIIKRKECPFCGKHVEYLTCGGTYVDTHAENREPMFITYVCDNVFCECKFLKIPKALCDKSSLY